MNPIWGALRVQHMMVWKKGPNSLPSPDLKKFLYRVECLKFLCFLFSIPYSVQGCFSNSGLARKINSWKNIKHRWYHNRIPWCWGNFWLIWGGHWLHWKIRNIYALDIALGITIDLTNDIHSGQYYRRKRSLAWRKSGTALPSIYSREMCRAIRDKLQQMAWVHPQLLFECYLNLLFRELEFIHNPLMRV